MLEEGKLSQMDPTVQYSGNVDLMLLILMLDSCLL